METEGFETILITDQIINEVNLENLSNEELDEMKRKKGRYPVNIMCRNITIDS
jgi:predicted  nucleic acid-binding Zn-ribbon protein